jgi:hypothetical protein
VVATTPAVRAHTDPPNANATGVTIEIVAFRSDASTPVLASDIGFGQGVISECEQIFYQATLRWAGGTNASFEAGNWSLTTPDGVVNDLGSVPCIGDPVTSTDDPDSGNNNGRGLCFGTPGFINSVQISYTVTPADIMAGTVAANTTYENGWAHLGDTDVFPVGATTPLPLTVATCDAPATECMQAEVCNPTTFLCDQLPEPDSTPCTDTDQNVCTTAGCEMGACVQDHVINEGATCDPGTPFDPECSSAACDATAVCVITPGEESTPCTDTDGNVCTVAGCDDAGVCDQDHIFPDSTPCPDTDDNECTVAGCNGAGACDPNHVLPNSTPCTDIDGDDSTTAGCDGAGTCDQQHIVVPTLNEVGLALLGLLLAVGAVLILNRRRGVGF